MAPEPTHQNERELRQFERELHQAFERRPAPPSLKRKIMERRRRQNTERLRHRMVFWQRLAACIVLAGALSGVYAWHNTTERRKGEEAREQVFTALRIAHHALNEMNAQLAARQNDVKQ